MIKLDDNLLQELGLGALPPEEKKKMLAHIYETLEMRVGMELAKQMTDAQLKEFEQFIERNDEAGALQWLETNFPNYKQVVSAEFDKLKLEIKQVAPQIVASSQQQAQMQASAGAASPYPAYQPAPGAYPPSPAPQQQPAPPLPGQFPPQQAPVPFNNPPQPPQPGGFGAQGGQQPQPYPSQPPIPPPTGPGGQPYSHPQQQPYPGQPPYPPAAV